MIHPDIKDLRLFAADPKLAKDFGIRLSAWATDYPEIDVRSEIRWAHAWLVENPTRRKKDNARFLGNWLRRTAHQVFRTRPGLTPHPEVLAMRQRTDKAMEIRHQGEQAAQEPGAKEAKARFLTKVQGYRNLGNLPCETG